MQTFIEVAFFPWLIGWVMFCGAMGGIAAREKIDGEEVFKGILAAAFWPLWLAAGAGWLIAGGDEADGKGGK